MSTSATIEAPAAPAPSLNTPNGIVTEIISRAPDRATTESHESEQKAAFDKIVGVHDAGDETPAQPQTGRDDKGRFAPAEPKTEPKPTTKTPAEPADEAEAEQTVRMERALGVLRREGFDRGMLGNLTDDQVLNLADKASKRQADIDRKLAANRPPTPEPNAPSGPPAQPEPQGKGPPAGFDAESFLTELEGEYGKPMAASVRGIVKGLTDHYQRELQARDQAMSQFGPAFEQMMWQVQRMAHAESHPALKDDAVFGKVRDKAIALAKSGGYANIEDCFSDAARLVASPTRAQVQRGMADEHRRRDVARPESALSGERVSDTPSGPHIKSGNDAALDVILRGGTVEQAERAKMRYEAAHP